MNCLLNNVLTDDISLKNKQILSLTLCLLTSYPGKFLRIETSPMSMEHVDDLLM